MSKPKIEVLLVACGLVACSGIAERTVSETTDQGGVNAGGTSLLAAGGHAGTGPHGGGGTGGRSDPTSGAPAGQAASAGAPPSAGAPSQASCAPGPNPIPVRALSSWEYRRRVADLTGNDIKITLPPDPVTQPPFAFSMLLNDDTIKLLFTEAETQSAAASAAALLPCDVSLARDGACAGQFVARFVGGAFRRPLTDAEGARYMNLYKMGSGGADPLGGVALVVQATLFSPLFLFKTYLGSGDGAGTQASTLTSYELVDRLASLFNGAGPGQELWALASKEPILSPEELVAEANQLMRGSRFIEAADRFHEQWLGLDELALARPELGAGRIAALGAETDHVILGVFTGDRRLATLFQFHDPVPFDPRQSSGILTLTGTLTRFSNPSQRGQFVRERLLCKPTPAMPPGLPSSVTVSATQTERQAWMEQLSAPSCLSCHSSIDPIGFAFEHFDRDGSFRDLDNGLPVDTSGVLVEGGVNSTSTPFKDLGELAVELAQSPQVADCVARTWLAYALERPLTAGDSCTIDEIEAAFSGSDLSFDALLTAIATSTPFRTRDVFAVPMLPPPVPTINGSLSDPLQRKKILLDFSLGEAMWLGQVVPAADRPTLDQYFSLLRDLEQSLSAISQGGPPAP